MQLPLSQQHNKQTNKQNKNIKEMVNMQHATIEL